MRAAGRLIVNADDFGRTPGINRGIVEAHVGGIVSSTTFMVNQPATEEAAALANEHPRLGVGLHLTLCEGTRSPLGSPRSQTPAAGSSTISTGWPSASTLPMYAARSTLSTPGSSR